MKIAICVNHSYPSVGGCEKVIKSISERLYEEFNIEVDVYSFSSIEDFVHNSVNYNNYERGKGFLLNCNGKWEKGYEHILIYSDVFHGLREILDFSDNIPCKKSLVLVGANKLIKDNSLLELYKTREDFTTILHSENYIDSEICKKNNIKYCVIPNGIDLEELRPSSSFQNFKKRFSLDKKVILCVANFFPGKGQEHLLKVGQELLLKRNDFDLVFVASKTGFPSLDQKMKQFPLNAKWAKVPCKFLFNLNRLEVVDAFFNSDVFAFPSQKEVSPIVILESMACKVPWVSLNVGNVKDLKGGIVVEKSIKSDNGNLGYNNETYKEFAEAIDLYLTNENKKNKDTEDGYSLILEKYNWNKIIPMYKEIICQK